MTKFERNVWHVACVRKRMTACIENLQHRLLEHDASKLVEPERSAYEGLNEALEGLEYGTDAYRQALRGHLGSALQHHYQHNSRHPEHYPNGIVGMSLFDLLEMLCDIRAVCDENGKVTIDLHVNKRIQNMSEDVYAILCNTLKELAW